MSKLKEFLKLSSFSKISGIKQPNITCPLIDNLINSYNSEISSLKDSINELSIEDDESNSLKIDHLHNKISDYENKISQLEQDRKIIADVRTMGLHNRNKFLNALEDSICLKNKIFFSYEIRNFNIEIMDFKYLNTDDNEILKNYSKVIEFTEFWNNPIDYFIDYLDGLFYDINKELTFTNSFYFDNLSYFFSGNYSQCDNRIDQILIELFDEYLETGTFYSNSKDLDNSTIKNNIFNNKMIYTFDSKCINLYRLYDKLSSYVYYIKYTDSDFFVLNKEDCVIKLNKENSQISSLLSGNFYHLNEDLLENLFPNYTEWATVYSNGNENDQGFYNLFLDKNSINDNQIYSAKINGFNLKKFCEDFNEDNESGTDIIYLSNQINFELI